MSRKLSRIDLTDIDLDFGKGKIDRLVRIDDFLFGSKVISTDQIEFLKDSSVKVVADLKQNDKTDFNDSEEFKKAGIEYIHFPIKDIDEISFERICELKNQLEKFSGHKLIYCMSGNRVGALFTLLLSDVLGHPKERAFHFGQKVGMVKEGLMEKVRNKINLKGSAA